MIAESAGNVSQTISFLKAYLANPNIQVTPLTTANDVTMGTKSYGIIALSTEGFGIRANSTYWSTLIWTSCGYISSYISFKDIIKY
jgi:hypothetical protein